MRKLTHWKQEQLIFQILQCEKKIDKQVIERLL